MGEKESAIIETKNLSNLYSAQFDYYDLVSRLHKIKKSRDKCTQRFFRSFDLSMKKKTTYTKRERVVTNLNYKPVKKIRFKSNVCEKKSIKKYNHRRSTSDKFYQSELIPLFTPGFTVYYKNNISIGRRLSS